MVRHSHLGSGAPLRRRRANLVSKAPRVINARRQHITSSCWRPNLTRALPGAGVGLGPLAAHRQPAAVPQATVRAQVHQALDVQLHLAAQITLDLM
jgi:hypothetical protein